MSRRGLLICGILSPILYAVADGVAGASWAEYSFWDGMVGLIAAMGFAAAEFGTRFRLYTIGTIVVILLFVGWTGVQGPRVEAGLPTPGLGVVERTWWYAYQLWFMLLAVRLLRENPATQRWMTPRAGTRLGGEGTLTTVPWPLPAQDPGPLLVEPSLSDGPGGYRRWRSAGRNLGSQREIGYRRYISQAPCPRRTNRQLLDSGG